MSGTQSIGPVAEQLDVREAAAKGREVPWAVDVGQRLEQADDADRQQRGNQEVSGRPAQLTPVALDPGRNPERQHYRQQHADRPASARVQQLIDRPAVRAGPLRMRAIEEDSACNSYVQLRRCKDDGQDDEDHERRLQVRPPEPE
jgi:hypothetical protein